MIDKRKNKKIYNFIKFSFFVYSLMLFYIGSLVLIVKPYQALPDEIVWTAEINFKETNDKSDYCVFGEATNAKGGLPVDNYDEPKPPSPFPPCIYAWFDDNLEEPYDILLKDYRSDDDRKYKQWNLSVQWMSYTGNTNLNISWDIDDIEDSEYNSMFLYHVDKNVNVEMLVLSYYEFQCPAWTIQDFKIICTSSEDQPPIASFNYEPINPITSDTIYFNSTSTDPDGTIVNWTWDFNDNNFGYGQQVTHKYNNDGSYDVELTVEDDKGFKDSYLQTIIIGNRQPVASFIYEPNNPKILDNIYFNSTSTDSDGTIVNWTWDFGDGSRGFGESIIHKYEKNGSYEVRLSVTDNNNKNDNCSAVIHIGILNNPPNNPLISGPKTGEKNIEYSYNITSTDIDNNDIYYNIDWGDNKTTTNFIPSGTILSINHKWSEAGMYKIIVSASDNITTSGISEFIILIDSIYVGNLGYLIDTDGDGIFDIFFSNTTFLKTNVEFYNEKYSIDVNGDFIWDYFYNVNSGEITPFSGKSENEIPWSIIFLVFSASAIIFLIIYFYKKGYF